MAVFPLFPEAATQTITITEDAQVLNITGRTVTLNVASGENGVASLPEGPVGLIFTLVAGTIANSATIVITDHDGVRTETFDAAGETVTLMLMPEGKSIVYPSLPVTDTTS